MYFDKYTEHQYGAHWEDIPNQVQFPDGARHDTVLKISQKAFLTLLKNLPEQQKD